MKNLPPKPDKLTHIGVDWDKTIFETSGYPDYAPTTLIPGAKEGLDKIVSMGYKVVVFTARPWSDLYLLKYLIKEHKLPVDQIICGKPLFLYMIDDRAITYSGDWSNVLDKIK
jgi:hypothetical protein